MPNRQGPDALLGSLATWRLTLDQIIDQMHEGQRMQRLILGLHAASDQLSRRDLSVEERVRAALTKFGQATGVFEVAVFQATEAGGTVFQMIDAWTIDTGRPIVPGRVLDAEQMKMVDWLGAFRAGEATVVRSDDPNPIARQMLSSIGAGSVLSKAAPSGPDYQTVAMFMSDNRRRTWTDAEVATLGTLAGMFDAALTTPEPSPTDSTPSARAE